MTAREVAWGWLPGGELVGANSASLVSPGGQARLVATPLEAIEEAVLPGLMRPPCLVLFSGGRDSSLILAAAIRVARREGLPAPVAFTQRFAGVEESREDEWQEEVVRHLGVEDWERLDLSDELDLVGPVAGPSLLRHGLVWPPLAHTHGTEWARARGGSIIDGEGGDEVFGSGRLRPVRALARTGRPSRQDLGRAAVAVSPRSLRTALFRRRYRDALALDWLRPLPRRELEQALARDLASEPLDWRRAVTRHPMLRGVHLAMGNLDTLGEEYDVSSLHPLLAPGVTAALARVGGPFGFPDRTIAMSRLFAGLLPQAVLARKTKARFNRVVFNEHSREFVSRWTGGGVDTELVDVEELRRIWSEPRVNALTFALLQGCWLAANAASQKSSGESRARARSSASD
jgi:asparagine synthase (glutamine-hydrolysing)